MKVFCLIFLFFSSIMAIGQNCTLWSASLLSTDDVSTCGNGAVDVNFEITGTDGDDDLFYVTITYNGLPTSFVDLPVYVGLHSYTIYEIPFQDVYVELYVTDVMGVECLEYDYSDPIFLADNSQWFVPAIGNIQSGDCLNPNATSVTIWPMGPGDYLLNNPSTYIITNLYTDQQMTEGTDFIHSTYTDNVVLTGLSPADYSITFLTSSCEEELTFIIPIDCIEGCADPFACNFNPEAEIDDGSCLYGADCGDFNGDGETNTADLLIITGNFGLTGFGIEGDMNNDGQVGTGDLLNFLSLFGV